MVFSSQMFQLFNFYLQSSCFAIVSKAQAAGQCCTKNWSFHLVLLLIIYVSVLRLNFGAVQ